MWGGARNGCFKRITWVWLFRIWRSKTISQNCKTLLLLQLASTIMSHVGLQHAATASKEIWRSCRSGSTVRLWRALEPSVAGSFSGHGRTSTKSCSCWCHLGEDGSGKEGEAKERARRKIAKFAWIILAFGRLLPRKTKIASPEKKSDLNMLMLAFSSITPLRKVGYGAVLGRSDPWISELT